MTALALSRRNTSVGLPNNDLPPPTPSPFLRPINTNVSSPTTSTGSGSLYHLCRSVLDRFSAIDGMTDYIEAENTTTDPLSKLTLICRQGYPLCTLYNALQPVKPIAVDADPTLNARNSCKANVYHFIVACRNDLLFHEEDIFCISDLYQDDTNGFVKVVNTINKVLQLLEDRGIIKVPSSNRNSDPNADPDAPRNTRDKVVLELLETERKYVEDMETLQNYMRELQIQKIVSPDTIHYLFGNLNALVDFQRRFLLQLEEIAEKSPQEQRIGFLFIQTEEAFSVYEPYCSNYYSAQDLVVQEAPRLQKLADILNPTYQLPSMLIKPVQRICKYPLLLNELVKSTDKSWPYYQESQLALEAIKRVTEKVNETQRQHENAKAVQELKQRLEDWKKLTLDDSGNLLLQEKLAVSTSPNDSSNEREFHVFLFDKEVLFCKESRGSNLLPKSNTLSINKKKRRGSLVPKMLLCTSSMSIHGSQIKNGVWSLYIDLKGCEVEQIALRFRNEEQLKLWTTTLSRTIQNAIDEFDRTSQIIPPYNDCDIESEYVTDFFDDEEDDYIIHQKMHNGSMNYQSLGQGKLAPTPIISGRPHHNVPGMNLLPLPRSQSSSSTTGPPPYVYYPVSPPPSYPSSPTASAVITNAESSENLNQQYLLYQQQCHQDSLLATGRSKSQSAEVVRPQMSRNPLVANRLRSQSSPNIMKNNQPIALMTPSHSHTTCEHRSTPLDLPRPEQPIISPEIIKIKLVLNYGVYAITTRHQISYLELMEKVEKKVRLHIKPTDTLRLKYQDEDGDFITINSDDDVQMAFESRGAHNTANLFVSL